jgi:trk system potassium uptake protein TrkA
VEIVELRVEENSRLAGAALHRLDSIVKCKVLVCAVLRAGQVSMPGGSFVLQPGDRVFITAPTAALATLVKSLGIATRKVSRVLLAGGGRISFYLAEALSKNGIGVTVLERDYERCRELAAALPKVEVVQGDASSQTMLERVDLAGCDAFVSLTGLDETNMLISMYAASLGVPQVITKVSRMENSTIIDTLPIGSVICPRELCCSSIVRYVRAMQNQTGAALSVHSIAAGKAEAMEFRADETTQHCGEPLKKLQLRPDVLVACISHAGQTEIPSGDSCFVPGDTLVIVTSADTVIGQLNQIFAG